MHGSETAHAVEYLINALNYITLTTIHDVGYTHIFVPGIIKREGQCDKECPPDPPKCFLGFRA
jgi:hypothetical protein